MSNLWKYFGFDKIDLLLKTIKFHGGLRHALYKIYRLEELQVGTLVGIDKFGNKYFENNEYQFGRNRWVEFSPKVGTDYDASQIPPEWFGWMHYKTDLLPKDANRANFNWIEEWEQNQTGTDKRYIPYSTTKPKIEAWKPGQKKSATN